MIFFFFSEEALSCIMFQSIHPFPGEKKKKKDHLNVTSEIFPRTFDGFSCLVGTDLNCTWEALYGLLIHCPP